jgi:hypothetical protein
MSMADAMRSVRELIPDWMGGRKEIPIEPPPTKTALEDMAEVVRMAGFIGQIDKHGSTWNVVAAWAANDLLETWVKLESADQREAIALQARAKAMRDLLEIDATPAKPVLMASSAPYIP